MKSTHLDMLFAPLLALGTKKTILENWVKIRHMNDPFTRDCIKRAMLAVTLADFDEALAPVMLRNDPVYPFAFRLGFKGRSATPPSANDAIFFGPLTYVSLDASEDAPNYWNDASSYRLVRFVPVPLLQLIAADDCVVYNVFQGRLSYSLANPNVMVIESRCGGHLGWQESPPDGGILHGGTSWADVATTDFIEAVFESYDPHKVVEIDKDSYFSQERDRNIRNVRSRL